MTGRRCLGHGCGDAGMPNVGVARYRSPHKALMRQGEKGWQSYDSGWEVAWRTGPVQTPPEPLRRGREDLKCCGAVESRPGSRGTAWLFRSFRMLCSFRKVLR